MQFFRQTKNKKQYTHTHTKQPITQSSSFLCQQKCTQNRSVPVTNLPVGIAAGELQSTAGNPTPFQLKSLREWSPRPLKSHYQAFQFFILNLPYFPLENRQKFSKCKKNVFLASEVLDCQSKKK